MTAPRFKRPTSSKPKEWTNAELDELRRDVDACLDFCEQANDYMHEDAGEAGANDKLRNFFLKKFSGDPDMADLVAAATEDD